MCGSQTKCSSTIPFSAQSVIFILKDRWLHSVVDNDGEKSTLRSHTNTKTHDRGCHSKAACRGEGSSCQHRAWQQSKTWVSVVLSTPTSDCQLCCVSRNRPALQIFLQGMRLPGLRGVGDKYNVNSPGTPVWAPDSSIRRYDDMAPNLLSVHLLLFTISHQR